MELAAAIAAAVDCAANVWQSSDGKIVRVYLSHRGKKYGFVTVALSGIEFALTSYANNAYGSAIRTTANGVTIDEPEQIAPSVRRLTASEADSIARQPRTIHNSDDGEWHFGAADEESF
jgi:hypothetical protein